MRPTENCSLMLPFYLQVSRSKLTGSSMQDGVSSPSPSPSLSLSLQESEVSQQLQSDAVERYLFLTEYMHQCGILWSPVIVAMYCYGSFLFLLLVYVFIVVPSLSTGMIVDIILFSFQSILFVVFPSLSLASANSVIAPVVHLFTNSGSRDFSMIGICYVYSCFLISILVEIHFRDCVNSTVFVLSIVLP